MPSNLCCARKHRLAAGAVHTSKKIAPSYTSGRGHIARTSWRACPMIPKPASKRRRPTRTPQRSNPSGPFSLSRATVAWRRISSGHTFAHHATFPSSTRRAQNGIRRGPVASRLAKPSSLINAKQYPAPWRKSRQGRVV